MEEVMWAFVVVGVFILLAGVILMTLDFIERQDPGGKE